MPLLTVANLHHSYGSQIVLDGATFSIEPGEKVGLVGRNGQGKTTLMRVILGALTPDAGQVQLQRSARVGYLSQDPSLNPEETLRGEAEGAFKALHELHLKLNDLFDKMTTAQGNDIERMLKQQARLESEIEAAGGYAIDHKIDATLHGLGFTDEQFNLKVSALSGGQKNRLGLARLLLEEPDLLLLDEPTNHLDIAGREWLETFLSEEYPGAVMLVSHDRWLLDRVVSRIIEVEAGRIREYPGNYEKYLELRRERQLTVARVFDKQQDRIRAEEQFIARYKAGQRAKQARGRQSRLERFKRDELVERPIELDVMKLNLPKAPRGGEQVIVADGITKRYGDLTLFEHLDLTVMRGERIGIIGPNGIGKTTLVRCLLGEIEPDEGSVRLGSRLEIGYYRQLHDHLDLSLTVWQYLQSVIVGLDGGARSSEQQARNLAGAFLFTADEQDKCLGDLSGGERSRVVLAGLMASAKNLLVLDEPTNHLDIPSAERLEQVLSMEGGYDGTLLLITHDRALLQTTCNRLLIFEHDHTHPPTPAATPTGGRVRNFYGTYLDWRERQSTGRHNAPAPAASTAPESSTRPKSKPRATAGQPSSDRKAPTDPVARLTLAQLESQIENIEKQLAEVDGELGDPAIYSDGEKVRELTTRRAHLTAELEPLESEWASRAEQSS